MAVPTNEEILVLLDRLDQNECADDLESQWLDFKPFGDPKEDKRVAVEYAVCFANAEGGVVVFGVADRVTAGRAKAIHGSKRFDLATWQRDIYQSTVPPLAVDLEEIRVSEGTGRVLVMRVEKGATPPYGTSQGVYKKRVGKSCMPIDLRAETRAEVATGAIDWSGGTAENVQLSDLDPVEVARARNWLRRLKPNSQLISVGDLDLLQGLKAVTDGKVTRTGLLLFGREDTLARRCPQHAVQYVYQTSPTTVARNDVMACGLLKILSDIEQAFTGPANPEHELSLGFGKLRIPSFSVEDTVREAILNAVTHRDYLDPGRVLVRHTPRELVVTSPGGFISGITPENILRHESRTRNQTLAFAFLKLGLVEQSGVGRRRIYMPVLSYGKKPPQYETDGHTVTLRIFDGSFDAPMAKLVAKWRHEGKDIDLDGLLILTYLREYAFIDTLSASRLLQLSREGVRGLLDYYSLPGLGILERKGHTAAATFHLTKSVASDLLGKAAYTKTKGIDPIRYSELVRCYVTDHGSITPAECRELIGLGESAADRSAVSKLLTKWCADDGFLRREGVSPRTRYYSRV